MIVEVLVLLCVLPVVFFVCYKLVRRFMPFLFGNGIKLSRVERDDLKKLEYDAYIVKAKELIVKRGESKAEDEFGS